MSCVLKKGFVTLGALIGMIATGGTAHATLLHVTANTARSYAQIETSTVGGSMSITSRVVGNTGPGGSGVLGNTYGLTVNNTTGGLYTVANSFSGLGSPQIATIDPTTGATAPIGTTDSPFGIPAIEMANDGTIYLGGVDGSFYRADGATGIAELVSHTSVFNVMDYAIDSRGALWAVTGLGGPNGGHSSNQLWNVDVATGEARVVFDIWGDPSINYEGGIMGIMFDEDDNLFATSMAWDSHLFLIDTTNGYATDLGSTGLQWAHGGDIRVTAGGQTQPVPEPGTMLLIGTGAIGLIGFRRRLNG